MSPSFPTGTNPSLQSVLQLLSFKSWLKHTQKKLCRCGSITSIRTLIFCHWMDVNRWTPLKETGSITSIVSMSDNGWHMDTSLHSGRKLLAFEWILTNQSCLKMDVWQDMKHAFIISLRNKYDYHLSGYETWNPYFTAESNVEPSPD